MIATFAYFCRVARQQVDNDLQILRITDFGNRCSRQDGLFTACQNLEDDAVNRGGDLHTTIAFGCADIDIAGLLQTRFCAGKLGLAQLYGRLRAGDLRFCKLLLTIGLLQLTG